MLYHDNNAIYLFEDGHSLADPQDSYRHDQTGGTRGYSTFFLQCDIATPLRWKMETDRIREGVSKSCLSAKPERVTYGRL